MKNIRIEPAADGRLLLIDVVCDCGENGLTDDEGGQESFKHVVRIGGVQDKILSCHCGKKYRLRPQGTHIHVFSE
jgi:hypothetical protein